MASLLISKTPIFDREHVATIATDEEVLARFAKRLLRLDIQDGDVVSVDLSRQTRATDDWNRLSRIREADTSCEEQIGQPAECSLGPHAEQTGVLEKEVPLLWKEERKTGQVDLLFVDFDLREIRLTVRSRLSPEATPYFTSTPTSPMRDPMRLPAVRDCLPPAST